VFFGSFWPPLSIVTVAPLLRRVAAPEESIRLFDPRVNCGTVGGVVGRTVGSETDRIPARLLEKDRCKAVRSRSVYSVRRVQTHVRRNERARGWGVPSGWPGPHGWAFFSSR
jgi:hypothetical protein